MKELSVFLKYVFNELHSLNCDVKRYISIINEINFAAEDVQRELLKLMQYQDYDALQCLVRLEVEKIGDIVYELTEDVANLNSALTVYVADCGCKLDDFRVAILSWRDITKHNYPNSEVLVIFNSMLRYLDEVCHGLSLAIQLRAKSD